MPGVSRTVGGWSLLQFDGVLCMFTWAISKTRQKWHVLCEMVTDGGDGRASLESKRLQSTDIAARTEHSVTSSTYECKISWMTGYVLCSMLRVPGLQLQHTRLAGWWVDKRGSGQTAESKVWRWSAMDALTDFTPRVTLPVALVSLASLVHCPLHPGASTTLIRHLSAFANQHPPFIRRLYQHTQHRQRQR